MDRIDEQILHLLRENARITSSDISKQVHLSVPAVSERIHKLEDTGLIRQFTVKLDREQLGLHLIAFVMVQIEKTEHIAGFRETVMQAECVLECHHIAGAYDYVLKVAVKGTADLERFISETLKQVEGVSKTNTNDRPVFHERGDVSLVAIWNGLLFGMMLQLSVGPVCLAVLHHAMTWRLRDALMMVLGVALADEVYMVGAIGGLSFAVTNPLGQTPSGRSSFWQACF